MARYPRRARSARLKCIPCNAPVVETVDGRYVCVSCGDSPVSPASTTEESVSEPVSADPASVAVNPPTGSSAEDG